MLLCQYHADFTDEVKGDILPSRENRLNVTIIGSGTSTGVPMPGCSCRVCTSTDAKNKRDRTSAYIEVSEELGILIDASTDLRHQALKWGIQHVEAVLYTHGHADHMLGTDDLRSFNFRQKNRIACYGTKQTLKTLKNTFPYIFSNNSGYQGGMLAQLDPIEIIAEKPFTIGGTEIIPFSLYHGAMEVLGFRVGEFAYATDCNSIPDASFETLKGVRYLILDGLRHKPHKTHFTIAEAIEAAQKIGAEQTYLIHMSHDIEHNETNASLPDGVELAYDGLTIDFI